MAARRKKHSLWLYYALSVVLLLVALLSVNWFVANKFRTFFIDQQRDNLEIYASTLASDFEKNGFPAGGVTVICSAVTRSDDTLRATLINPAGEVLCDSIASVEKMENHGERPEVLAAYSGDSGSVIRFSETLQAPLLYVAVPLSNPDGVWVLRMARSLAAINDLLYEVIRDLVATFILLVAAVCLSSVYVYRKINPPLDEIRQSAEQYARGEFGRKLPDYQVTEISELATALNQMADKLDSLENLRREFVANVSHELKTPVTTIKGFTETLIEGAKNDPADLERFLGIIAHQTDRLANIIDDLLTLSRLESAPLSEVLALDWYDLCELLESSREVCQSRADKKNINLDIDCNTRVPVQVDQSLLLQAIVNLIDNAINYSPEHSTVKVVARVDKEQVWIDVTDDGPGIMETHIPRLFERFYRADKARSRKLGGTGLGLAIVKHIANVHRGEVSVSSSVGSGSTFTIMLPKNS